MNGAHKSYYAQVYMSNSLRISLFMLLESIEVMRFWRYGDEEKRKQTEGK